MAQNGADILARVLARNGVDTCFANPGTTEMHLVTAFTHDLGITCHLCLFEGVATGAADGYARMARKPAATLLHLGPGLANGIANLHNARKAASPVINIVGEHAIDHIAHDAPLTADIEGLARPVSKTVTTIRETGRIDADVTDMLQEIQTGPTGVGTLIVPNDIAWDTAQQSNLPPRAPPRPRPPMPKPLPRRQRPCANPARSCCWAAPISPAAPSNSAMPSPRKPARACAPRPRPPAPPVAADCPKWPAFRSRSTRRSKPSPTRATQSSPGPARRWPSSPIPNAPAPSSPRAARSRASPRPRAISKRRSRRWPIISMQNPWPCRPPTCRPAAWRDHARGTGRRRGQCPARSGNRGG